MAVWKEHKEIVEILLKHSANPNIIDERGDTPLHWVASYGSTQITKMLLD
jgi:ankyrin repeat protein